MNQQHQITASDLLFGKNNEKPMFNDRRQIKSWIQNKLLPLGILVVIERSDDTKIVFKCKSYRYSSAFKKIRQKRVSKKQKLLLQKQGLLETVELEQKLKQKKLKSKNCSCPFRIRANFSIRSNKWSIVIVNGQHNHPLKNCRTETGEFFNDESFNRDIHVNLVKNRFHTNPIEPEMVEDIDYEIPKKIFKKEINNSSEKLIDLPTMITEENVYSKNEELNNKIMDDLSSLSSENSMEDFLSTHGSLAQLTTEPTIDNFEIPNLNDNNKANEINYDSPFFEPVNDDDLNNGISTVNELIDDFFNKKSNNQNDPRLKNDRSNNFNLDNTYYSKNSNNNYDNNSLMMMNNFNSNNNNINNNDISIPSIDQSNFNNFENSLLMNSNLLPNNNTTTTTTTTNNNNNNNFYFNDNSLQNSSNEELNGVTITTFFNDCPALY